MIRAAVYSRGGWPSLNNGLLSIALCMGWIPTVFAAEATPASAAQQIIRAGEQASLAGPDDYFSGRVRIDPLSVANNDINASTAYVTFEPGARSAWHTHPKGQYLVVTSGVGMIQEWGQPRQTIRPGDVIWCPPGIKHWHGASVSSAMTHLAVTGTVDGKNANWMETVSDQEYRDR